MSGDSGGGGVSGGVRNFPFRSSLLGLTQFCFPTKRGKNNRYFDTPRHTREEQFLRPRTLQASNHCTQPTTHRTIAKLQSRLVVSSCNDWEASISRSLPHSLVPFSLHFLDDHSRTYENHSRTSSENSDKESECHTSISRSSHPSCRLP